MRHTPTLSSVPSALIALLLVLSVTADSGGPKVEIVQPLHDSEVPGTPTLGIRIIVTGVGYYVAEVFMLD